MGHPFHGSDRWASAVIDSWIWGLPHTHFRVFFACVGLAASEPTVHRSPAWGTVEVPAGGLLISLARLAERAGVSVAVVRGALANLSRGTDGTDGVIGVTTSARGYTLITVPAAWVAAAAHQQHSVTAESSTPITAAAPASTAQRQHSHDHTGSTATSTAIVDGGGGSREHSADHTDRTATARPRAGTKGALSDPDHGRGSLFQKRSVDDPAPPATDDDDGEEGGDESKVTARAARIPPRGWAGADYLRSCILEHDPGNIVSRKPWGPDVRRGLRLAWADELRLMVERDGRDWDEVAKTIGWLFKGQTESTKFVVLSAGALRSKWDRIQEARRRQKAAADAQPRTAQPFQAGPPAAFANAPERKSWNRR